MNINQVNEILREYEASGLESDLVIDGFSFWIKLKNDIFTFLTKDTISIGVERKRFFNLFSIFFYFLNIFFLFRLFFLKKKVFISTALSGISDNKDLFTNSLRSRYDSFFYFLNIGEVERIKSNKLFFKENFVFSDNLFLWPLKFFAVKSAVYFLPKKQKNAIFNLINFFEAKGVEIPYKLVASSFITYAVGYYFYYYFFKLTKPIKCYIVSAYSKSDLCAACIKSSIPVFEIQHGIVGAEHRGYNYYAKNFRSSVTIPTPQKIIVTNNFWKKELLGAGYFQEKQIIVGENYKLARVNTEFSKQFQYVVFSGQGIDYDSIERFYIKSEDYLSANNYRLLYKPHPREDIVIIKKRFSKYPLLHIYEGIETAETLIYKSIAHVSFYSSCHFDAVEMKGKTLILRNKLSLLMNRYVDKYPNQFVVINSLGEKI